MEKMNQVNVTEFMSKSKEEMYDMAVEMVEKYNRLVDICNDSAERMADLMTNDDGKDEQIYDLEAVKYGCFTRAKNLEIKKLKEENSRLNARIKCDTEYWKEAFETQSTSLAEVRKLNDELVDTLNKSSDRIDELEEEVTQYKELIDGLNKDLTYWKDQERIRTDQLRATESKVEELYKQIEGLTVNCRSKSTEIARLRKEMADIKHELSKEDDHGRAGFKKYIEWLIEEEERAVPDRFKARLNEEITEIFEKEEETEVKGVGRTSSGRYPWGAKIIRCEKPDNFHCIYGDDCSVEAMEKCKFAKELKSDIPCGEDSIE